MTGQWKTIESAPKDGTVILLAQPYTDGEWIIHAAAWHANQATWYDREFEHPTWEQQFTHWMPLPDPPAGPHLK